MVDCTEKNQVSLIDQCLTLWIFLAMAAGIAIGYYSPAVPMMITNFPIGNSSIPIAIGIILLIVPSARDSKSLEYVMMRGEYDISVSYRINQENDHTRHQ
jgi:hypothetical protein